MRDGDRLVYSTDGGRQASEQRSQSRPSKPSNAPDDGVVRIFRERGGRGGKTVTVIRGLPTKDLDARSVELKRLCGAGGTVRDGAIEVQGDHRDRVAERLRALGYAVKLAGG